MTAQIQVRRDEAADWTTNNPVLKSGEFGFEVDTGMYKIGDGNTAWATLPYASPGVFTAYTPSLVQVGTPTLTVDSAKYQKIGKSVKGWAKVTVASGTGTTNNAITLSTPVPALTAGVIVGTGYYNDGGTQYQAVAYLASTTTIALLSTHGTASATTDDPIGVNPNIAVAPSDIFNVQFEYEAA